MSVLFTKLKENGRHGLIPERLSSFPRPFYPLLKQVMYTQCFAPFKIRVTVFRGGLEK